MITPLYCKDSRLSRDLVSVESGVGEISYLEFSNNCNYYYYRSQTKPKPNGLVTFFYKTEA